ncbi:TBC1 domain family member 22A [Cucumispora dikerogammari]|nr:TBC1 domain family member 22A [Cucumispora dikerogammari]
MKDNKSFQTYLNNKKTSIEKCLNEKTVNISQIKMLCWGGIPGIYRPVCYKILLNCAPSDVNDFNEFDTKLNKIYHDKMKEYKRESEALKLLHENTRHISDNKIQSTQNTEIGTEKNSENTKQITIDVQRLGNSAFTSTSTDVIAKEKEIYINILKLYSYSEPSVGYVQGMADILVPFFKTLSNEKYAEAIIFSCFSSYMDRFKDNFIGQQHGTEVLVYRMIGIIKKLDPEIYEHSFKTKLDFRLCVFRWFNVIFTREFDQRIYFIILDTLLTTEDYNSFAVYFAASIIIKYREVILGNNEPEENIIFLQNLKIINWNIEDLLLLFSNVYVHTYNSK